MSRSRKGFLTSEKRSGGRSRGSWHVQEQGQLARAGAGAVGKLNLFCRSASVLGRPRRSEAHQLVTRNLFCRSGPSSAAPVDQKPVNQSHATSSVGARPHRSGSPYIFFRPCLRNQALLNRQSLGSLHRRAFTGLFSIYRTVFQ